MEHKSFDRVQLRNTLLLVLGALIWGVAFVAQSVGMAYIGPCPFNAVRSYIGGLVLLPLIFWNRRLQAGKPQEADPARMGDGLGNGPQQAGFSRPVAAYHHQPIPRG